jgi:hypothetical protein
MVDPRGKGRARRKPGFVTRPDRDSAPISLTAMGIRAESDVSARGGPVDTGDRSGHQWVDLLA